MSVTDPITFELQHGVQFRVWNASGEIGIAAIADFLAESVNHFKGARSKLGTAIYDGGPYWREVRKGRKVLGKLELSHPSADGLSASRWAESVIRAYATADTVEQMAEALPEWLEAANRDGGGMSETVEMLKEPDGELCALSAMLKRFPKAS
jgi:hypothetical protein